MVTYKKLKYNGADVVQVRSAQRDGTGRDIADTYYVKPSTGIPRTDMSTDVQLSLGKADTSVQKASNAMKLYGTDDNGAEKQYTVAPSNEYPASTSTDNEIPTSLAVYTVVSEKYAKPQGGIPKTDLASDVQTSLGKADTALQSVVAGPGISVSSNTIRETYPVYYARPNEATATATLTVTISNFPSAYADGIMIALRMPFANSASSTLNVNGLGAKPVYYANTTTSASRLAANSVVMLVYETTTVSTGCWKAVYSYDSNNTTSCRQSIATGDNNRPLLMSYANTSSTAANVDNVTYRNNSIYANPSTGKITATSGSVASGDAQLVTGGTVYTALQSYAPKASPALTGTPTAPTATAGTNTTQIATTAFVKNAIDNLPEPMLFKGTLGTGGTITSLPTAAAGNEGYVYKVITDGTYASQSAKVGDTFISTGSAWVLIPSGDEPSGTVTNVATGVGLTGGPITFSGTIKAKLKSETNATYDSNTITNTSNRQYAVVPDKTNGYLSVNVPWTDANVYQYAATASDNTEYPILLKDQSGYNGVNSSVRFSPSTHPVTVNPSTGTITAEHFYNSTTSSPLDFIVGSITSLTEVD